jgi:hypothetical protein
MKISGTGCTDFVGSAVIVLEIDGDITEDDVTKELEALLGSTVLVIEANKGIFEVFLIDNAMAKTLLDAFNACRK